MSTDAENVRYRAEHEIQVSGDSVPAPWSSLDQKALGDLRAAMLAQGISQPTPIQAQAWPVAAAGSDLVGIAATGSGKARCCCHGRYRLRTLAYGVPAVLHADAARVAGADDALEPAVPSVLVLAPTRELALQIEAQIHPLCQALARQLKCLAVVGGEPKDRQIRAVRAGIDILVATPGRLLDLVAAGAATLGQISCVVLDEVDRMLSMNFEPQVRDLLSQTASPRQTLLWSATWPSDVEQLVASMLRKPVKIVVRRAGMRTPSGLSQEVRMVEDSTKAAELEKLLDESFDGGRVLCFCSTRRRCDALTRSLRSNGWPALGTHGHKCQIERDWVMREFRSGEQPILVATDVAARGLDVHDIQLVCNFDMPDHIEAYVHRVGRSGRAGRPGRAVSFFVPSADARLAPALARLLLDAKQPLPADLLQSAAVLAVPS